MCPPGIQLARGKAFFFNGFHHLRRMIGVDSFQRRQHPIHRPSGQFSLRQAYPPARIHFHGQFQATFNPMRASSQTHRDLIDLLSMRFHQRLNQAAFLQHLPRSSRLPPQQSEQTVSFSARPNFSRNGVPSQSPIRFIATVTVQQHPASIRLRADNDRLLLAVFRQRPLQFIQTVIRIHPEGLQIQFDLMALDLLNSHRVTIHEVTLACGSLEYHIVYVCNPPLKLCNSLVSRRFSEYQVYFCNLCFKAA